MGKFKFHDGNTITIMGRFKFHDANITTTGFLYSMMGILLTAMGKSKFHDGNAITIMGKIKFHDVNTITTMGTIQFLMMGIELLQWKKFKSSNGKRITVMENIKETYYPPAVGCSIIYSYGYNTKKREICSSCVTKMSIPRI